MKVNTGQSVITDMTILRGIGLIEAVLHIWGRNRLSDHTFRLRLSRYQFHKLRVNKRRLEIECYSSQLLSCAFRILLRLNRKYLEERKSLFD